MKKIDYKVEQGKLIRLRVKIKDGFIENIKINGDFFVYPETGIFMIEKFLINKKINEFCPLLEEFINKKNLKIIGFTALDLQEALKRGLNN